LFWGFAVDGSLNLRRLYYKNDQILTGKDKLFILLNSLIIYESLGSKLINRLEHLKGCCIKCVGVFVQGLMVSL
jgi:hypothetical protein